MDNPPSLFAINSLIIVCNYELENYNLPAIDLFKIFFKSNVTNV